MPQIPNEKDYLTPKEAADYLRRGVRTLEDWRKEKRGPRFYRRGEGRKACILYRRRDLDDWLAQHASW